LEHILFFGLLVLAVVPSLAPRWSWFFVTTALFVGVAVLNTWLFVRELPDAGNGAPFGFAGYLLVAAALYLGSCALRLLVAMVVAVLRRLAPTPESLFAAAVSRSSAPPASE
jgi:hypothetical protein